MAETFSRTMNIYVEAGEAQRAYQQLSNQQTALNGKIQEYLDKGKQVPEKLSKQFEAVTKQMDTQSKKLSGELSPSMKDLTATYSKLTSELSRMSKEDPGFDVKRKQTIEAKQALENYKSSVSGVSTALKESSASASSLPFLGQFGDKINAMSGKLPSLGSAFKSLWAIIIANPFMAIAAAVAGFVSLLTRNAEVADQLSFIMAGLKKSLDIVVDGTVNLIKVFSGQLITALKNPVQFIQSIGDSIKENIINRFKGFGELFTAIADGDLRRAGNALFQIGTGVTNVSDKINGAVESLKNFGNQVRTAAQEGYDAAKALDDLVAAQGRLGLEVAKNNREIAKQETIYKDATRSNQERIAAIDRLIALEQRNASIRVQLANAELNAEEKSLAGRTLSSEQEKKIYDLKAKREEALQSLEDNTRKAVNKRAELLAGLKSEQDEFIAFRQKLLDLQQETQAALQSDNDKEIAKVKIKYAALEAELKKFLTAHKIDIAQYQETEKLLIQDFNNEMQNLNEKDFANRSEMEYQATLVVTQKFYDDKKILLRQSLADGLINEHEYNASVAVLDSMALHAKVAIANDYKATAKNAANDIVKFNKDAADKDVQNTIDAEKRKKEGQDYIRNSKSTVAKASGDPDSIYADELAQLDEWHATEQAKWKDNEEVLTQINEEYEAKRALLTKNHNLQKAQIAMQYVQQVVGIFNQLGQMFSSIENAEIASEKRKNKESIKQYDDALKNKRMSQKLHDILVEQANESLAKKEDELKKKQFERNKAFQIVNAGMAAAGSIVQALNSPWPASIAFAALAGATALAQIGIIASSEYTPAYADGTASYGNGTKKLGGQKHSGPNGGNWIVDPSTGQVVSTIEEGEAIIPADANANNPQIIDQLLTTGRKKSLIDNMRPVQAMNFDRSISNIQYANGGVWGINKSTEPNSNNSGFYSNSDTNAMSETNKLLREQNKHLQSIAAKDLTLSVKEVSKQSNDYSGIVVSG